jgi:hypothetical protein
MRVHEKQMGTALFLFRGKGGKCFNSTGVSNVVWEKG